jgi:hypothetical protein
MWAEIDQEMKDIVADLLYDNRDIQAEAVSRIPSVQERLKMSAAAYDAALVRLGFNPSKPYLMQEHTSTTAPVEATLPDWDTFPESLRERIWLNLLTAPDADEVRNAQALGLRSLEQEQMQISEALMAAAVELGWSDPNAI